jgi:RNA-directed DNA polymerase
MKPGLGVQVVQKLEILSVNRLAQLLDVPKEKLVRVASLPDGNYDPFMATKPRRPFQRKPASSPRPIDNPLRELRWIQKRIYKRLLRPICFPEHIVGSIPKRSVKNNAERHLSAPLLVTLDVKQCFPSINNSQVYSVWRELLDCSTPVATLLTKLTTFKRHLPQGAATSPLLANLFIWMIDEPIRRRCDELNVAYSTFIDDLGFSGIRAREIIQTVATVFRRHALRLSRRKIKIMGPSEIKIITGTRLGGDRVRAPKDKLSRIR